MRIYLNLFLLFFSMTALAESQADFFKRGVEFYLKNDYDSAKEMFKYSKAGDDEIARQSKFYLASIAGYQGDSGALDVFKEALANPPKGSELKLLSIFANFALINNAQKQLIEVLKPIVDSKKSDSQLDWYYALALSLESKDEAKVFWNEKLTEYFDSKDSIGCDLFVESILDNEEFAKSFNLSDLPKNTQASKARIAIIEDAQIIQEQQEISFLAQIVLAESGADIDEQFLAQTIYKYRDVPFAWRGAYVLGKIAFEKGDYKKAQFYARDALQLSPPDMDYQKNIYLLLGDSFRMQKDYKQAIYNYEKMFLNRSVQGQLAAESLYKAGICYYEQGKWWEAHMYFERVFIAYFKFEYWGSRAYYYDARALYSLGLTKDANATLLEYFKRCRDTKSDIYKQAQKFYKDI